MECTGQWNIAKHFHQKTKYSNSSTKYLHFILDYSKDDEVEASLVRRAKYVAVFSLSLRYDFGGIWKNNITTDEKLRSILPTMLKFTPGAAWYWFTNITTNKNQCRQQIRFKNSTTTGGKRSLNQRESFSNREHREIKFRKEKVISWRR